MSLTQQELIRLAGIKEDYDGSTPGIWYAVEKGNTVPSHSVVRYAVGEKAVNIASGISPKTGNAAFIVNAHGAIPFLLSLLDRLAQEPEVVRCGECIHCKPLPDNKRGYFSDGVKCCEILRGDETYGVSTVWDDGYCDEGERKEQADGID